MGRTLGPPVFIFAFFILKILAEDLLEPEVTILPPLPQCDPYQACSAEVSVYPILIPTSAPSIEENIIGDPGYQAFSIHAEEGSGEGSGDEIWQMAVTTTPEATAFPLYDEFVSTPTIFDFNATANVSQKRLCRCPDSEVEGEGRWNPFFVP